MRIRLSLVRGPQPSEHVFEIQGGTFGRSLKCDWVLSDEERILSAIHGRVVFENNKFILVDESTNGIFLDGRQQPLGRGNGVALGSGLRFRAAKHLIEVQVMPAAAPTFSPAPALPHAHQPVWQNAAPSAEQALRERGDMGDVWAKNSQDPLAYLGSAPWPEVAASALAVPYADPLFSPSPRQPDPFAGMIANGQPAVPAPQPIPAHFIPAPDPREQFSTPAFSPQPATGLSAGFDPLQPRPPVASQPNVVPPPSPAPQPMPAAAPQKLIPDDFDPLSILAGPARRSLEPRQETGYGAASPAPFAAISSAPFGAQLLAGALPVQSIPIPPSHGPLPPAREPLSPSLMADLARLSEPAAIRPAGTEYPSGEFDAIEAMKARREERKARLIEKAAGDGGHRPVAPTFAQLPASIPGMPLPSTVATLPAPLGPRPLPAMSGEPFAAASGHLPQPAGRTIAGADTTGLVALLTGMGLPGANIPPERQLEVMQEVGEMVRAFSDGLILLLSARRMVKSEFRMDETQVQPEENNPFKHFKMAELALDELFVTRSGGFQAPGEAAQSALEDLKQHVMLTMAAMQRAIKLLMERLSPEHAARDNEAEGAHRIRGLGARKGKWETYVDMHQRMSSNFDGVARQLIAEAFAQVQEEQARRIASQYWENKK